MHGLILAAGKPDWEGQSDCRPTVFQHIDGKTLYERHLDAIEPVCDTVTVVLGYGFVDCPRSHPDPPTRTGTFEGAIRVRQEGLIDPVPEIREEVIEAWLGTPHDVEVVAVVIPHWDATGTAEYCRLGLEETSGNVLLLEGDVIYRTHVLRTMVAEYNTRLAANGLSALGVEPTREDEDRSVSWNMERQITAYGDLSGHEVAGIFFVNEDHVKRSCELLTSIQQKQFLSIFPALDSTYIPTPPDSHLRIDSPGQIERANGMVNEWTGRPFPSQSSRS